MGVKMFGVQFAICLIEKQDIWYDDCSTKCNLSNRGIGYMILEVYLFDKGCTFSQNEKIKYFPLWRSKYLLEKLLEFVNKDMLKVDYHFMKVLGRIYRMTCLVVMIS